MTEKTQCQSVAAGDFDNDMDIDLFVACSGLTHNHADRVYENIDGKRFRVSLIDNDPYSGSSSFVAVADYNGDGFLDVLAANGAIDAIFPRGNVQLWSNVGNENHWVKFDLEGTESNRDGYGSRLFLVAGGRTQMREFDGGNRAHSQDDQVVHFGLADYEEIEAFAVQWPNSTIEWFDLVGIDALHRIREGDGHHRHGSQDLALFASKKVAVAGEIVTFVAAYSTKLDPSSFVWNTGGQAECDGAAVCAVKFSKTGETEVSVRWTKAANEVVSARLSVTVVPQ